MIDRRALLAATVPTLVSGRALAAAMSRVSAYAFTFNGLDGDRILLASYAGRPMMIVNTASRCLSRGVDLRLRPW